MTREELSSQIDLVKIQTVADYYNTRFSFQSSLFSALLVGWIFGALAAYYSIATYFHTLDLSNPQSIPAFVIFYVILFAGVFLLLAAILKFHADYKSKLKSLDTQFDKLGKREAIDKFERLIGK